MFRDASTTQQSAWNNMLRTLQAVDDKGEVVEAISYVPVSTHFEISVLITLPSTFFTLWISPDSRQYITENLLGEPSGIRKLMVCICHTYRCKYLPLY